MQLLLSNLDRRVDNAELALALTGILLYVLGIGSLVRPSIFGIGVVVRIGIVEHLL